MLKGRGRENNQNTGVLYLRNMGVIAAKLDLKDLVLSHFPGIKRWFVPMAPMLLLDWNRLFSAYTSYLASGTAITFHILNTKVNTLKFVVSSLIEFGVHFP